MTRALLALLLAAGARAQDPAADVTRALARVDALVAREPGQDARVIADLDRRAAAEYASIAPLGWRAARPLGGYARDRSHPAKTRLFAVTFLAKLGDPASFEPLSAVLLDPEQDPDARLAAAQGLPTLDAPPAALSRTLCAALAQPALPRFIEDEALIALSRRGCDDPAPLARAARAFGPRPRARDLETAHRALEALARSRGNEPLRRLLALSAYFPSRSSARAAAISAMASRSTDVAAGPAPEALPVVRDALLSETAEPAEMLDLVRLADALGPAADPLLLPLASHPDAEVLAAAAEALARRKAVAALPALETVIAGAMSDPRFAPKPGRPDPTQLLSRIDAAAQALRRARDEQK